MCDAQLHVLELLQVRKRLVAVQLPAGAAPIEAQQLREKVREAVAENDLLRAELHRWLDQTAYPLGTNFDLLWMCCF